MTEAWVAVLVAVGERHCSHVRACGELMFSRREFLVQVAAAGSTVAFAGTDSGVTGEASSESKPLRVLILGGTGNIGPYHVRAAVARGHQVSVFSRGRSAAELPAGVERLIGDRNGDLNSIR